MNVFLRQLVAWRRRCDVSTTYCHVLCLQSKLHKHNSKYNILFFSHTRNHKFKCLSADWPLSGGKFTPWIVWIACVYAMCGGDKYFLSFFPLRLFFVIYYSYYYYQIIIFCWYHTICMRREGNWWIEGEGNES